MGNQSKGRKISKFLAQTSIPSDAKLTYISGNVNYQISIADFLTSIGVTGTIVQKGDPLATPVLNVSGSINEIRNIEDGSGIKSSVSAQGGVDLEHNFIEDSTGVELVVDLTADQPKFRSLVAGSGINVAASNGSIQIALSATPVSTKTVIINSISDFPAAVGGIITLEDNTEYAIRNDITTSNRFIIGNNCVLSGSDSLVVAFSYTGAGIMLTSVNKSWRVKSLSLNATTGQLFDVTGSGVEIFQFGDCIIDVDTIGVIGGINGFEISGIQFQIATTGLTFSGANGVGLIEDMFGALSAGIMYDLDSATFDAISLDNNFSTLAAGAIFLSGLASSGNINSGGLGTLHNSRFFGSGAPLQNISEDDDRWQFFINDDIPDTHPDGLLSMSGNATNTVISVASTPVLVDGTWVVEHSSQFTGTTGGRLTYNGVKDIHADVTISLSAAPISGTNKIIGFFLAVNGTEIANSEAKNNLSAGDIGRTTVVWRATISPGDFIETFISNDTDTTDILVTDAVLRVS